MKKVEMPRRLHIRSLNDLSRCHLPTYVGARLLAESIHPSHIEDWTNNYIGRKAQTGRTQVYWKHSLFKGFKDDGEHDYRKCVIGSPTTQLTEVWLLDCLSRERQFDLPPYVYSYAFSSHNSCNIYKYFYPGYRSRENSVSEVASKITGSKIVIFDLRNFYPSINVNRLRRRFGDLIAKSSMSVNERETANECVAELTNIKHETGLPIGPPLSHALANVFLSKLDKRLSEKYPGRYFRYVDDVAIVSPIDEVDSVKRFFKAVVEGESLEVHPGKLYEIDSEVWINQMYRRASNGAEKFGLLLQDIRRYLAHHPEEFENLRNTFLSEGFTLPFSRLRSVATSSRPYRRYLANLFNWKSRNISLRPGAMIRRARDVRIHLLKRLDHSLEEIDHLSEGVSRRWHIQNLRNLLNRSLYLLPDDRKAEILRRVPDLEELRPTRTVLQALVTGDASALSKYPGPTVAAFCELWRETRREKPEFYWARNPIKQERDSVSVLALHGLCSPTEDWIEKLNDESDRVMINLSSREQPTRRHYDNFSYIDELESLFLKPNIDFDRILSTRFDDGEDVILSALNLGGSHYVS